ncbi:unnamed protein product [Linum tenue]|uniref:Uncharacterized protein n=1 Tax=Linum tenue TaxID=586396 RepID=A0AAV0NKB6_9ROSI|nr:unnamed protein product [Linum tenue]
MLQGISRRSWEKEVLVLSIKAHFLIRVL